MDIELKFLLRALCFVVGMIIGAVIFFGPWDWLPMTKDDLRKATEEIRAQNARMVDERSFEEIFKQGQEAERARPQEQKK